MDVFSIISTFNFNLLAIIFIGVMVGIFFGSLPGLTATMSVVLVLPISFGMDAVTGMLLIISVYFGSIYGGCLTAILINTPGTPSAAATAIDGYELTKQGLAYKALTVSTISSVTGGILSVILLIFLAPQMAGVAVNFSAPETFALALFGLSIISSISGDSILKGLIAGLVGLLIASIGLDPIGGFPRFSFGSTNMMGGIDFLPVMIGLFAAAQAFHSIEDIFSKEKILFSVKKIKLKWNEFKGLILNILRSSGMGAFIGMIPGAGGDIAAFAAYNEAKRFSKNPEKFGKGHLGGVAAPEAANNATTGGAMVPLMTLGIPGDAPTAVMLGALMIHGLQPGPMLFQNSVEVVHSLFVGMIVANIFILVCGLYGIRLFIKVLYIPKQVLSPLILVLCVLGAYALGYNFFDVWVMLVSGIIGYFMIKYRIPALPVILALILGPLLESNYRRSLLMSSGSYDIFYTRPVTAILLILAFLALFTPFIKQIITKKGRLLENELT
ncbi:tripartite tricarboxylate transporter permease [Halalkalibacter oceani]|nr:tripartite tricarboxylate transporter permease [Halalkalibacter oceani]